MALAKTIRWLWPLLLLGTFAPAFGQEAASRVALHGHVPGVVSRLAPLGRLSAATNLNLSIGLPLRNTAELKELIRQQQDPGSTNYHRYLTPQDFTARFGPTEQQYQSVIRFAESSGFHVTRTHTNRLLLDVAGNVPDIERAFRVTLRVYQHPTQARRFFSPDVEPSVPTNLPVTDMWGLSDFAKPRPLSRMLELTNATPLNYNGSGPSGTYRGFDFRNAYAPRATQTGAGQTLAVVEFDGYYTQDITNYERVCGYSNVPVAKHQGG